jgi:hypothetical protein
MIFGLLLMAVVGPYRGSERVGARSRKNQQYAFFANSIAKNAPSCRIPRLERGSPLKKQMIPSRPKDGKYALKMVT